MSSLVPNAVWALIIDSSVSGAKKFLAFERYLFAVEVEIKKADETLKNRVHMRQGGVEYSKDRRDNSRIESTLNNEVARTRLEALRRELEDWKRRIRGDERDKIWEEFQYTLTPGSQETLESPGRRALELDEELKSRRASPDEMNARHRNDEEWNWKQEEHRRKERQRRNLDALSKVYFPISLRSDPQETPPSQPARTGFSGGRVELSLESLNDSFESPRRIIVPSWSTTYRIRRLPGPNETITEMNNNKWLFNNSTLSSEHADIWCGDRGTIWIKDLGSRNGTFVNGTRLSLPKEKSVLPYELRLGDIIELGMDIYDRATGQTIQYPRLAARIQQITLIKDGVTLQPAEN